jgi:two-component system, chemotaxis family, sensor kinase Cph1
VLPEDRPHVLSVIREAIRTKSAFELEHRVVRTDGAVGWTFSRAIPLLDEKGNILEWFGAASDVTERRRAEEKLNRQSEELAAANRELESFSYSASHDLRAPLNTMTGFIEILMEDYADKLDESGKDYLQRIKRNAVKMIGTVDDLLALSRVA